MTTAPTASATLKSIARNREPGMRGGNRSPNTNSSRTAAHQAAKNRMFESLSSQRCDAPSAPRISAATARARTGSHESVRDIANARRQRHASARTLRNKVSIAALRKNATSEKYNEPVANELKCTDNDKFTTSVSNGLGRRVPYSSMIHSSRNTLSDSSAAMI